MTSDIFGQGILYELQLNSASTVPTVPAKAHNIGDTKNMCKVSDNVFIGPLGAGIVLYCQVWGTKKETQLCLPSPPFAHVY